MLNQSKTIKQSAPKGVAIVYRRGWSFTSGFNCNKGFDKETFDVLGGSLLKVVVYGRWSHMKIRVRFLLFATYNFFLFASYSCCPNHSKALVYHC